MTHRVIAIFMLSLSALTACAGSEASPTPAAQATQAPQPTQAAGPQATAAAVTAPPAGKAPTVAAKAAAQAGAPVAGGVRWELQQGTEARYLVREQLANIPAPSDAVGRTEAVSGAIVLDPDGQVVEEASRIEVDLRTLRSDSGMRDQFIQRNPLQTSRHPTTVFVPTEVRGLPWPLPSSGEVTFELIGDLTIRDVTRPVTWDVNATVQDGQVEGVARTEFTFEEFNLDKPNVARVLSISDPIRLELDFQAQRA